MSPHLSSFRERAQINGTPLSEEELMSYMEKVFKLCVSLDIPATEFEISFLIGAMHFSANCCDAVVLEVSID